MRDELRGLYRKYEVRRADGSSDAGEKHEACEFFVLDTDHDKFALYALVAYAQFCEAEFPELAQDLRALCLRKERARWQREDAGRAAALAAGDSTPKDGEP